MLGARVSQSLTFRAVSGLTETKKERPDSTSVSSPRVGFVSLNTPTTSRRTARPATSARRQRNANGSGVGGSRHSRSSSYGPPGHRRWSYFKLVCGHLTTPEIQEAFSYWKVPRKYFCDEGCGWVGRKRTPRYKYPDVPPF